MRRTLTKLPYPAIGRSTTTTSISAALSTSSGDNNNNSGRGRGRGSPLPSQFTADSRSEDSTPRPPPQGHGKPDPSFRNGNDKITPPLGRGRGVASPPQPQKPKLPFLFVDGHEPQPTQSQPPKDGGRHDLFSALSGSGRGKPISAAPPPPTENRHIRRREPSQPFTPQPPQASPPAASADKGPALTQEEKIKKAKAILSKGDSSVRADSVGVVRGGEGGSRGRGRGRGRAEAGREGRDRRGRRERGEEIEDDSNSSSDIFGDLSGVMGDEELSKKFGQEFVDQLNDGFEEASHTVLPSPMHNAMLDAWHTNLLIECEPEFFMEEFGTNPDIHENPPMPLRDALEKVKPFMMSYLGIQTHEEWEEAINDTMKTVPLMKEIVDHYGGPDRATAKQQNEELERVAKTLPASAPASVKRFTDRAVLSLQSNPGWGFDKKCMFMDKLVMEVSKQYN